MPGSTMATACAAAFLFNSSNVMDFFLILPQLNARYYHSIIRKFPKKNGSMNGHFHDLHWNRPNSRHEMIDVTLIILQTMDMIHEKSPNPATIVFDLDGTLADTAGDIIATLNAILGKLDLAPLPLESAREMIGAGARVLLQRGLKASGVSVTPARLEELFQDFLAHYEIHLAYEKIGRAHV